MAVFLIYRLNERVLKVEKNSWLNMIGDVPKTEDVSVWSAQDTSTWLMEKMRYVYITRRSAVNHLYSFWIIVDLNLSVGRQLLREAFEYVVSNRKVELKYIRKFSV